LRETFPISVQVVAFISAFTLAVIVGIIIIPMLKRFKFGQTVRDDGPSTHLAKTGTPTMGGLIFLIPITLISAILSFNYHEIIVLVIVTLGFGAVGFIDDFIKISKKRKDGLYWDQKMIALLVVAVTFVIYAMEKGILNTEIIVPFMGVDYTFNLPIWFFVPFTILVLISTTNAVNLTDGIDGLAAGVTLIVMVFFTIVAMTRSEWDYIKIFSSIVAGGCLGFLAFNIHPAKVFMGDTGSLAFGGAVGAVSILMQMPWILLIAGIIYVIEALSVLIQVGYFKYKGKRVFKMAPIHHHFELSGWEETKVVTVFWIITLISCFIGMLVLRLKFY
jgi:phospho-N-acetylmuramoyl-pentapeptide-transferase